MLLKTTRCTVRPFQARDLDDFIAYRNDAAWMRHQGYKCLPRETYERDLLGHPSLEKGAQYAIISNDSGHCIGDIYLRLEGGSLWIGYTIAPPCARQGYAFEVVSALACWAKAYGYPSLKAGVLPGNAPSIRLLEKLGFSFIGMEDAARIYSLECG